MFVLVANTPQILPPDATKIILALFLSFLIGLEREEHKASVDKYVFGGIRTYPLIGLLGYAMALLSGAQLWPLTIGFAVVASFLWLSYQHKLQSGEAVGVTTEFSGLTTYVVGALVSQGHFWIAATLAVLSVLLLELKLFLEGLSRRIPAQEIFTFTKFLFLTVVILPIVPNQDLGPYKINLFKTWLVVVAVSALSYGSYLLLLLTKGKRGMILSALLGGAYSSTIATVVLSKRARESAGSPQLFSGAILMASGVMYLRLAVLIGIFNQPLLTRIAVPLLLLAAIGLAAGWLWTRRSDGQAKEESKAILPRNPLELWMAFLFGGIFIAMLVLTELALTHLGRGGVFGLAAIMGFSDVDPFVLSLTQSAGTLSSLAVAAAAILIATASNNAVKAFYALGFADRKTGRQSFGLLLAFAALGLVPLFWMLR
ncbi:MAG TPA: MgtC/SapB family protein [Candidatus Acidoferrales bacterium]|nr:MgtC/SapB family protein [Candidatus Acidoferrales bacterium]